MFSRCPRLSVKPKDPVGPMIIKVFVEDEDASWNPVQSSPREEKQKCQDLGENICFCSIFE